MGVNSDKYDSAKHHIISNASCTTNCLVPMVKVIRDTFGFVHGSMVTIHSYTNDQNDPRPAAQGPAPRARGGAVDHSDDHRRREGHSLVIPELKGKIDGIAIRVPTPDVSLTDLTVVVEQAGDDRRGQRRVQGGRRGRR